MRDPLVSAATEGKSADGGRNSDEVSRGWTSLSLIPDSMLREVEDDDDDRYEALSSIKFRLVMTWESTSSLGCEDSGKK